MPVKLLLLTTVFLFSFNNWLINLDDARVLARKEHKCILLNFSGSDWCGPCIRMRKDIFESRVFTKMADTQLVLVNADFPRNKKNQLSPDQQKINDEMADKYNPKGEFPLTLILNSEGRILKSWEGLPDLTAELFTEEVRNVIYTNEVNK
jgi:thioredoxin-related protein